MDTFRTHLPVDPVRLYERHNTNARIRVPERGIFVRVRGDIVRANGVDIGYRMFSTYMVDPSRVHPPALLRHCLRITSTRGPTSRTQTLVLLPNVIPGIGFDRWQRNRLSWYWPREARDPETANFFTLGRIADGPGGVGFWRHEVDNTPDPDAPPRVDLSQDREHSNFWARFYAVLAATDPNFFWHGTAAPATPEAPAVPTVDGVPLQKGIRAKYIYAQEIEPAQASPLTRYVQVYSDRLGAELKDLARGEGPETPLMRVAPADHYQALRAEHAAATEKLRRVPNLRMWDGKYARFLPRRMGIAYDGHWGAPIRYTCPLPACLITMDPVSHDFDVHCLEEFPTFSRPRAVWWIHDMYTYYCPGTFREAIQEALTNNEIELAADLGTRCVTDTIKGDHPVYHNWHRPTRAQAQYLLQWYHDNPAYDRVRDIADAFEMPASTLGTELPEWYDPDAPAPDTPAGPLDALMTAIANHDADATERRQRRTRFRVEGLPYVPPTDLDGPALMETPPEAFEPAPDQPGAPDYEEDPEDPEIADNNHGQGPDPEITALPRDPTMQQLVVPNPPEFRDILAPEPFQARDVPTTPIRIGIPR